MSWEYLIAFAPVYIPDKVLSASNNSICLQFSEQIGNILCSFHAAQMSVCLVLPRLICNCTTVIPTFFLRKYVFTSPELKKVRSSAGADHGSGLRRPLVCYPVDVTLPSKCFTPQMLLRLKSDPTPQMFPTGCHPPWMPPRDLSLRTYLGGPRRQTLAFVAKSPVEFSWTMIQTKNGWAQKYFGPFDTFLSGEFSVDFLLLFLYFCCGFFPWQLLQWDDEFVVMWVRMNGK